jgi:hypothetical protein
MEVIDKNFLAAAQNQTLNILLVKKIINYFFNCPPV